MFNQLSRVQIIFLDESLEYIYVILFNVWLWHFYYCWVLYSMPDISFCVAIGYLYEFFFVYYFVPWINRDPSIWTTLSCLISLPSNLEHLSIFMCWTNICMKAVSFDVFSWQGWIHLFLQFQCSQTNSWISLSLFILVTLFRIVTQIQHFFIYSFCLVCNLLAKPTLLHIPHILHFPLIHISCFIVLSFWEPCFLLLKFVYSELAFHLVFFFHLMFSLSCFAMPIFLYYFVVNGFVRQIWKLFVSIQDVFLHTLLIWILL